MKNVIIGIISICFLFIQTISYSETTGYDSVIKINKDVIQGKVLQVTNTSIEMDPKGNIPFLLIPRDSVEMIIYSDGTSVNFTVKTKAPQPLRLYCEDDYMERVAPVIQIMSKEQPYVTGLWYFWQYSIPNMPASANIAAPQLDGVGKFFYYDANGNKVPFTIKQNGSYVLDTGSVLGAFNLFKKPKYKIKNFTLEILIYDNYVLVDSRTFTEPEFIINFRVADDLSPKERITPGKDMYFPELTYKNIVLKPHYTMSYVDIYSFGTAGPFPFNTEFTLDIEYTN